MARRTIDGLMRAGITHVVGIPDNTSGPLFDQILRHPMIRLITVTREGEAFAVAAGLWLGGASPLVVIQNTGLLEAGDGIRGTAQRMGAPIPFVVTGRGYAKMLKAGITRDDPRTRELLTRPDVDSTALLTEPTLDAWGVPFRRCDADDDPVLALEDLIRSARDARLPAALVLTRGLD